MKICIVFILLANFIVFNTWSQDKNSRPNVIIIFTDDQGTLDLNCYGSKDLYTPNFDKLASTGVRFTQFYAAAPVCSPSRAALLTGKTNLRAGLPGNVPVPEHTPANGKYGMPAEQFTIAEMLKEQNYFTALIGKWHLGHDVDKLPNGQGFDYFFGHQRGCIDNYSHFFFWSGPNKHDLYRNNEEVFYPGRHFVDLMTEEVINIIEEKKENPFFIYWAINAPHYPYQGAEKWRKHYKDMEMPRREYAAFISTVDEKVGQVLDVLEATKQRDKTIIIFQSDHGHSCEERAFWGGGNAGPYRGCKFSLFEGGIRVPAIISFPGVIPQNQVRDQVAISMDWFPTIAELVNSKSGENLDGKSLIPIINNAQAVSDHETLFWQLGSYDDSLAQWAVRQGPWKLIGNPKDPSDRTKDPLNEKLFLVNIEKDPSEQINLADSNQKKLTELQFLHVDWLKNLRNEMKR